MPVSNLNRRHFSDEEKTQITATIDQLTQLLRENIVNLSPEERQRYGSINEQNKLLINKVDDYQSSQPELSSPDVQWEEFTHDYDSRQFLESTLNRLQSLSIGITNAKTLHDWDNYQDALTDYSYAQYKFGTAARTTKTK